MEDSCLRESSLCVCVRAHVLFSVWLLMHCDMWQNLWEKLPIILRPPARGNYATIFRCCSCAGSVVIQQISCRFWVRRPSPFAFGDLLLSPTATKAKLAQRRASEVHIRDIRRTSELDWEKKPGLGRRIPMNFDNHPENEKWKNEKRTSFFT